MESKISLPSADLQSRRRIDISRRGCIIAHEFPEPAIPLFIFLLLIAAIFPFMKLSAAVPIAELTAGNTAFALDLYRQLDSGDDNLFFSPYSISTCLAMTYAGARGTTEAQMAQTLHFNTNQASFDVTFGDLQARLNTIQRKQDVQLYIANGLWAQQGHPFLKPFFNIATGNYGAKIKQVDFRTEAEPARKEINGWVSDHTKGKIADLIGPRVLNDLTRLVLVNAIYFKGKWVNQFKENRTSDQPFFLAPDGQIQARLMHLAASFKYAETGDLQLLELPYRGGDVSMVVLLPSDKDGLKNFEKVLNRKRLDVWLEQVRNREVDVFLLKFKLTQQFALSPKLAAMGMAAAFSLGADFSGMDGTRELFISDVIHQAFVEVNEEGTEAAAATAVAVAGRAVRRPEPMPLFRADHPFLFLIRDTHSGSILFLGRVTNPAK